MSLWALRSFIEDGRTTIRCWKNYRNQTGRRPWFWIAVHLLNWVIAVSGTLVMVWFATNYHFSQWGFLGIFLVFALPYGFFWLWLKRKLKLTQLRRQRLLAKVNAGRYSVKF